MNDERRRIRTRLVTTSGVILVFYLARGELNLEELNIYYEVISFKNKVMLRYIFVVVYSYFFFRFAITENKHFIKHLINNYESSTENLTIFQKFKRFYIPRKFSKEYSDKKIQLNKGVSNRKVEVDEIDINQDVDSISKFDWKRGILHLNINKEKLGLRNVFEIKMNRLLYLPFFFIGILKFLFNDTFWENYLPYLMYFTSISLILMDYFDIIS